MSENLPSLVEIRSLHKKYILTNTISPPTKALYFTKKATPRATALINRILMLLVCIHKKNNNNEREKKKSNVVSSSVNLQSQMKPGIDANKIPESKAFLGP